MSLPPIFIHLILSIGEFIIDFSKYLFTKLQVNELISTTKLENQSFLLLICIYQRSLYSKTDISLLVRIRNIRNNNKKAPGSGRDTNAKCSTV